MSHRTPPIPFNAETPPVLRLLERPARRVRTPTPLDDEEGWLERQVERLARWAVRAPWRSRTPR